MYHGLAFAFEMKCTCAGPKARHNEDEYLGRRIVFTENGLEIHKDPKHAALLLKETGKETCKSVTSPMFQTRNCWIPWQTTPGQTCHPLTLENIGAQWHVWYYMAQDRPDLDVMACTLANTMAHPKFGDEWLVKRVCRYSKGRPRYA